MSLNKLGLKFIISNGFSVFSSKSSKRMLSRFKLLIIFTAENKYLYSISISSSSFELYTSVNLYVGTHVKEPLLSCAILYNLDV